MDDRDYEPIETVDMVGGDVSLDFVNTGSARVVGPFRERLQSFGDLVTWAVRASLLTDAEAAAARTQAAARPAEATRTLERARELREAIYRIFTARAAEADPAEADLGTLSAAVAEAAGARTLVSAGEGFEYAWREEDRLDRLVWPVAISAAELLTSGELERVKECATDDCNWLFLDASRNRSRRWCDMKDCGNRAKARRHYARRKRARGVEG